MHIIVIILTFLKVRAYINLNKLRKQWGFQIDNNQQQKYLLYTCKL